MIFIAKSSKRPEYDGYKFASNTEVDFYKLLQEKMKDKKIKSFDYSVDKFTVIPSYTDFKGRKFAEVTYTIDFKITLNDGEVIYVDTKGGDARQHDPKEIVKLRLVQHQNPNIKVYWISKISKFLGGSWVETTPYYDFMTKIRSRYAKKYPEEKKLHWSKKTFKYDETMWGDDFEFEKIADCFYIWKKTKTLKKVK